MTNLDDFLRKALAASAEVAEGEALDAQAAALVELGVAVAVTSLDVAAIEAAVARAFDAGTAIVQVQEVIALVSGLGVHSLMASSARVLEEAARRGLIDRDAPLDAEQQALWAECVGDDPFWIGFEKDVPGFLESLLRLSPDVFRGFFAYCAIPWRSGTVRPLVKELIAMATDATPTHRFMPGFRVHLRNALKLGVGRKALLQTLAIAAAAPVHRGVD